MKKYFFSLVFLFFLFISNSTAYAMEDFEEDTEIIHQTQRHSLQTATQDQEDDHDPPLVVQKLGKKAFRKALAQLILGNVDPMLSFLQAAGRRVLSGSSA